MLGKGFIIAVIKVTIFYVESAAELDRRLLIELLDGMKRFIR